MRTRQDPLSEPGGLTPLGRPLIGPGERCLQLAGQGRPADSPEPVEHHHVVTLALQVLDIERGLGDQTQMLGQCGRDQLPLQLPVREPLHGLKAPVVRAEKCPQIPTCHVPPPKR